MKNLNVLLAACAFVFATIAAIGSNANSELLITEYYKNPSTGQCVQEATPCGAGSKDCTFTKTGVGTVEGWESDNDPATACEYRAKMN